MIRFPEDYGKLSQEVSQSSRLPRMNRPSASIMGSRTVDQTFYIFPPSALTSHSHESGLAGSRCVEKDGRRW